jgi:hypothetical protein
MYEDFPVRTITFRRLKKSITIVPSNLRSLIICGIVVTAFALSIPYICKALLWACELIKAIF